MASSSVDDIVTKRVVLKSETYKELKKIIIDLECDDDGKITPVMMGIAIDHIVAKYKEKSFSKEELQQ